MLSISVWFVCSTFCSLLWTLRTFFNENIYYLLKKKKSAESYDISKAKTKCLQSLYFVDKWLAKFGNNIMNCQGGEEISNFFFC